MIDNEDNNDEINSNVSDEMSNNNEFSPSIDTVSLPYKQNSKLLMIIE